MQAVLFTIIVYPAVGFSWSTYKVVWFFYTILCTFLYFKTLGSLIVSLSPNAKVAIILASASYTILNLFSRFMIPEPVRTLLTILLRKIMFLLHIETENDSLHFKMDRDYFIYIWFSFYFLNS